MQTQEPSSHSFIVKVWAEEFIPACNQTFWRGHVTHVGSGERRYLQSLDKVAEFIEPYLQALNSGCAEPSMNIPPEETE